MNFVFNWLVDGNAFGCAATTRESILAYSLDRIRVMLFEWYSSERKAGRDFTPVQALTPHMVGARGSGECGLQGAEANTMLRFVVSVLLASQEARRVAGWTDVARAGKALCRMLGLLPEHKGNWPKPAHQEMCDEYKVHLRLARALGMQLKPKHHQGCHLVNSIWRFGSPALYGCWFEEQMNQHLKAVCARAHRWQWSWRVLVEFRAAHGAAAPQPERTDNF